MKTMVASFTLSATRSGDQGAGRGDPGEDAFFRRQPARHRLGIGLHDGFVGVHAAAVEDLGQVGFGPFADAGDLRAFGRLRATTWIAALRDFR